MRVEEVMTNNAIACAPETNLEAAALLMWDNDCGTLPVVAEHGHVIGMLTDRDICMATALNHRAPADIAVGTVTTGNVFSCSPESDVREAMETMRTEGVRRLPVVKPDGTLCGIISLDDIIFKAAENRDRDAPAITSAEVIDVFKTICKRHVLTPVPHPEMFATTQALENVNHVQ